MRVIGRIILCCCCAMISVTPAFAADKDLKFTHGPIVGRPSADSMTIWARTSRPAAMHVVYGTEPDRMSSHTASVTSTVDHDLTACIPIAGLRPHTRYFYEIVIDGTASEAARR